MQFATKNKINSLNTAMLTDDDERNRTFIYETRLYCKLQNQIFGIAICSLLSL